MKIAFLGLGNMGLPMARNLLRAGHQLTIYNRTRSKAEPLRSDGANVAGSPAEAVGGAEIVFTMVADDAALEQVMSEQTLAAMAKASIHVSASTVSVALVERLTGMHASNGQQQVSAPVFGRPEAAEAAKLFVIAAGARDSVDKCQPLFDVLGQRTFVVGADPKLANVIKLSGNFMIMSVIEALGEALALTRKYGIDPAFSVDLLTSTLFNAPVYKTYGNLIAREQFDPPGFALRLGFKDVRLALAAAEAASVPMPVASIIHDHALSAVANGMSELDWAALAKVAAQNAGLGPSR